jgi:hypothetical protein
VESGVTQPLFPTTTEFRRFSETVGSEGRRVSL